MREFIFMDRRDTYEARRARRLLDRRPYTPSPKVLRYEQRADDEGRALAAQYGYLL
jgi:hypothetical protein